MTIKKAYTGIKDIWCLQFTISKLFFIFLFFFIPSICFSQEEPQYDEVTIYLRVQGIGGIDVQALVKKEELYLSISDVFTFLKIKSNSSQRLDSLSGFFINQQDEYLIDGVKKQIIFQGKKLDLKPDDLILSETNFYMKASLFGDVFGLICTFNLRDLSVELTTKIELPLIREMKMEQMRNNLKRLNGEIKTDTTIGRSYPLFKFGIADWSIATSQFNGASQYAQMNLNLGSVVAGGEMNVGLNYDPNLQFDSRRQSYLWRFANNDFKIVRQVSVGKMMPQTISLLNGSLIGIQLTNSPTMYRRSFGTYTMSNVTEPNWLVELYINNVLVNYVKADASGFYKFEVPLVYGNSVVKVRMYGPWGEVRERVENANIPFNFLPPGELEYTINAGVIEKQTDTKLFRTNINYGLSRKMSIGGGYEYFSSPTLVNTLPYISSSLMLLNNLLLSGEYTFGVRFKSSLSYRLPSNIQLNVNYIGFDKGQKTLLSSPVQQRGISISMPIMGRHFSTYSNLSFDQLIYSDYKLTNASFLFSGTFYGISSNVTTYATITNPNQFTAYTDFALSFVFPGQIYLIPSAQYNYKQNQWTLINLNLQKPLFKNGFLNITYKNDIIRKINSIEMGLRYDFSFMQTSLSSRLSKNVNSFSQSANGSLMFDKKSNYVGTSKTSMVGRGGFSFLAYLDLNGNGKRDKNEPKVLGLNVKINGGRIVKSDKDSIIHVVDLVPYTSYLVELDKNAFKSISWKIKKTNLNIYADPNQFKMIEIPVEVMAETTGTVNLKTKYGSRGLGRVYVNFYRNNQELVGKVLTEDDGYYSYMGLIPGQYVARMDSSQLRKIRMTATPDFKAFTVKESREGDFVEGIDFTLMSNAKDTTEVILPKVDSSKIKIINYASNGVKEGAAVGANNQEMRAENNIPGVRYSQAIPGAGKKEGTDNTTKSEDLKALNLKGKPNATLIKATDQNAQISEAEGQRCSIQYGEYKLEKDALSDQKTITMTTGRPVIIVKEGDVYKLWIEGFNSRRDARAFLASLGKVEMPANVDREVVAMNRVSAVSNADEKHIPVPVKESKISDIVIPAGKNQLIDYTDSIANIYKFEPEGSKTRGFPTKGKQNDISNIDERINTKQLPVSGNVNSSNINARKQNNENPVVERGQFSVLVDGFIFDKSATAALRRISAVTKQPIIISIKNGFYNLLIEGFANRREAKLFEEKLVLMGFKGTIVKSNP